MTLQTPAGSHSDGSTPGPTSGEMVQVPLEPLELANTGPDLGAMPLNELQHMSTWGCSGIANPNYLPDLREA